VNWAPWRKGKWADLVITTGDLLEIQTGIKHLYIKGKEVELSNKQDTAVREVRGKVSRHECLPRPDSSDAWLTRTKARPR